jgi:hypothetical protein
MKCARRFVVVIVWLFALGSVARASSIPIRTLSLGNQALTGAAGTTVGWDFTITNTSDFLLVTSSDFCVRPTNSPCSNSLGTYTDFIASNQFVVVGPSPESPSVSQSFDPITLSGVGSFFINATANPHDTVIGQIVLTYDLFSVSPNDPGFNPILDTLANGNFLVADASVSVPVSSATPEPETGVLLLAALIVAFCFWRK